MRLLSYNILDGGTDRRDLVTGVIAAARPDVVALVEAQDVAVVEHVARSLRMDFVHAPGSEGGAAALLSRWAIRESVNHAALRPRAGKSFVIATVDVPGWGPVPVGVVHLHARATDADETRREGELDVILSVVEPLRVAGRPHLLAGDFNANSPVQEIDLARCKPRTRENAAANGGVIPRRVVQRLLDFGYLDTYAVRYPEAAQHDVTFTTRHPGQRVDYVFAWGIGADRIADASIIRSDAATPASDHFPILVELRP